MYENYKLCINCDFVICNCIDFMHNWIIKNEWFNILRRRVYLPLRTGMYAHCDLVQAHRAQGSGNYNFVGKLSAWNGNPSFFYFLCGAYTSDIATYCVWGWPVCGNSWPPVANKKCNGLCVLHHFCLWLQKAMGLS